MDEGGIGCLLLVAIAVLVGALLWGFPGSQDDDRAEGPGRQQVAAPSDPPPGKDAAPAPLGVSVGTWPGWQPIAVGLGGIYAIGLYLARKHAIEAKREGKTDAEVAVVGLATWALSVLTVPYFLLTNLLRGIGKLFTYGAQIDTDDPQRGGTSRTRGERGAKPPRPPSEEEI